VRSPRSCCAWPRSRRYRLYALAAKEYGPSGSASCNSSNGNAVSSSCIFYDVTLGDIDAHCTSLSGTLYNCYLPAGSTYGVLSTSNASYQLAYGTQTGCDFATGIGTVNVANLVSGWNERANTHDFNGDGTSDRLWHDTSGNVAIWETTARRSESGYLVRRECCRQLVDSRPRKKLRYRCYLAWRQLG
jgi:hypothetical protein